MADIFREVDEAVREDRAKRLWLRYGRLAVTAALLIVAVTAGYVWWQNDQQARRNQGTAVLAAALNQSEGSTLEAADALAGMAATADRGLATIARLYEAALLADANNPAAVAAYEQVAADAEVDPLWRDFAQLMAVLNRIDSGDPATLTALLTPLSAPDNPWRFSARELTGLLAVRDGEQARAADIFAELAADVMAPAGIRERAGNLADWLSAD